MPGLASYLVCPRCRYKIRQDTHFTEKIKEEYPNAFAPWTVAEDQKLMDLVDAGTPLIGICSALKRQPTAIKRRIELLSYTVKPEQPAKPVSNQENWKVEEERQLKELEASHARTADRAATRKRK